MFNISIVFFFKRFKQNYKKDIEPPTTDCTFVPHAVTVIMAFCAKLLLDNELGVTSVFLNILLLSLISNFLLLHFENATPDVPKASSAKVMI